MHAERSRPGRAIAAGVGAVCTALATWEALVRAGVADALLVSSPMRIAAASLSMATSAAVWRDVAVTAGTFVLAVSLGFVLGAVVGVAMGRSAALAAVLAPFVVALNATPKVVLLPLFVLWIGLGPPVSLALGVLMASFPVLVATHAGVRALDRDLVVVARSFGASRALTFTHLVLPGVLPSALAGLRVGVSYALVGVLVGELFASPRGLGQRLTLAMANFEIDAFFACAAVVVALALAATAIVAAFERRAGRWRTEPT